MGPLERNGQLFSGKWGRLREMLHFWEEEETLPREQPLEPFHLLHGYLAPKKHHPPRTLQ